MVDSQQRTCFVCCSHEGELLEDTCKCTTVVHLACLKQMRRQTASHAKRCAACLTPYDSRSDPPWRERFFFCEGSMAIADFVGPLVPQLLLVICGLLANCPVCEILLTLEICLLLVSFVVLACMYALSPDYLSGSGSPPQWRLPNSRPECLRVAW